MTGGHPRLVLVGPPGAGKSSVAAVLAQRHGLDVRETDDDVAAAAGQPVAEIFVDHGEARFRELERDAVAAALSQHDGIVCVGSGAVQDPQVRDLLAGHPVVHLDVGLADAARRTGLDAVRPFQLGNVRGQLKQLLDARRPLYRAVATSEVSTDGRSVEDVADAVWAHVRGGGSTDDR
jgi:shikimate kinase